MSAVRRFIILVACALSVVPAYAQQTTLKIYGWGDYLDQTVLDKFTAETGVGVKYDVYNSLAELEATLALPHSGYDIVMPTNEPTLSRLVRAGLLAPIDRALVPNWKNLDPALMRLVDGSDPGNKYGAIFLWGTLGLGIIPDKVRALVPDFPLDSLDLLFKPEYARRLKQCGITVLDSPAEVIPTVLHYLGRSPASTDPSDLAAVEQTLMAIRPYITAFSASSALETLADGSTCLALAFSGNVEQAAARAKAANQGIQVRYIVPREGAQLSIDVLSIPLDAPHKDAANVFINFILRPDIIAHITDVTHYANAVPASRSMIAPALLADTEIFPTAEQFKRYFMAGPVALAPKMARNRVWARFKEGH